MDRTDLAASVPSTRQWRLQALPGYLAPGQVKQVLDRIDRRTLWTKDYAVLLLLARLGLRANEIATMALDDIDWQTVRSTIRGKGRRASSDATGRPSRRRHGRLSAEQSPTSGTSRRVFLRELAPHIGFASASNVSAIAKSAFIRRHKVPRLGSPFFSVTAWPRIFFVRGCIALTDIAKCCVIRLRIATRIYAKVDITGCVLLGCVGLECAMSAFTDRVA